MSASVPKLSDSPWSRTRSSIRSFEIATSRVPRRLTILPVGGVGLEGGVEPARVHRQLGQELVVGKSHDPAGGVRGRARVLDRVSLIDQDDVGPPQPGEVVGRRRSDDARRR